MKIYYESSYSTPDFISHHGIPGMKWGIRRYQNKDGSLTPKGRKRLGLDEFDEKHGEDIILKKNTKANRVISTDRYEEMADTDFGGSEKIAKKYLDDIIKRDDKQTSKYLSVDNIRNSGRISGKEYYLSWFTNGGYEPESAHVANYTFKRDVKIASGKKVVETLMEEYGFDNTAKMLKNKDRVKSLTLDYTKDRDLRDRIDAKIKKQGYDGVEDINDLDTDMPIRIFDPQKNIARDSNIQSGREAIEEILKRR